jgi:archaellum component FlaG (FlaF/FlaG flagellin family)
MAEAITEMIFLIVGISLALSVIGTVIVSTERMNSAMGATSSQLYDKMSSKIKIINDPLSMSGSPSKQLIVYVQNVGKTTLSTNAVLMIDGEAKECKEYMLEGEAWASSSVLCLEIEYPRLPEGEHRVTVVAENGVMDSMVFRV